MICIYIYRLLDEIIKCYKPTKARRGPVLVQSTGKTFKKNRSHNLKLENFPNMSNAILLIFLTPFEQCLKPSVDKIAG